ncbi:MAG TPA: hypothetical protein VLT35_04475, partial [Methanocella sp.]|nr:hypothetical protein [Methanocella sp.]
MGVGPVTGITGPGVGEPAAGIYVVLLEKISLKFSDKNGIADAVWEVRPRADPRIGYRNRLAENMLKPG